MFSAPTQSRAGAPREANRCRIVLNSNGRSALLIRRGVGPEKADWAVHVSAARRAFRSRVRISAAMNTVKEMTQVCFSFASYRL